MSPDNTNAPADAGGGGEDIAITDRDLYEHANSDAPSSPPPRGEEPPAQAEASAPQEQVQPPQPEGTQPRDEHGRFAPRQQPQQAPPQQDQPRPQPQPGQEHHVPLRTYLDEREQRYRIQAEADQMRQAWARLQQEQQQAAIAAQQQAMPQTIYDNPDQYLFHNIIAPLRQEMEMNQRATKDAMSREFANAQFGPQEINAALQDMQRIRHTPQGNTLFWEIMNSGHPYGSLVMWHRRARAQHEIGDPTTYRQRTQEQLLNDPAFQQEAAKRWYAQQQQQRGNGQRPPNVQLPPSLSSLPASSGRVDEGDMSDRSLWDHANR